MTCAKCNQGVVEAVRVDEPKDSGYFSEEYECNVCGAKGYVHGREEKMPGEWTRFGECFSTDMDGTPL